MPKCQVWAGFAVNCTGNSAQTAHAAGRFPLDALFEPSRDPQSPIYPRKTHVTRLLSNVSARLGTLIKGLEVGGNVGSQLLRWAFLTTSPTPVAAKSRTATRCAR